MIGGDQLQGCQRDNLESPQYRRRVSLWRRCFLQIYRSPRGTFPEINLENKFLKMAPVAKTPVVNIILKHKVRTSVPARKAARVSFRQ